MLPPLYCHACSQLKEVKHFDSNLQNRASLASDTGHRTNKDAGASWLLHAVGVPKDKPSETQSTGDLLLV